MHTLLEECPNCASRDIAATMSQLFPTDSNDLTVHRDTVLRLLTDAGHNGLALSKLVVRKSADRAHQERAVKELDKTGEIKSRRQGRSTRYWLADSLPPQVSPEEKADEVLRRSFPEQRAGRLLTLSRIKDELLKGMGVPEAAILTCLRVLEREGLVVKLTDGTKTFYGYVPAMRTLLGADPLAPPSLPPATSQPATPTSRIQDPLPSRVSRASDAPLPVTNQRVIEAYRSVRLQRRLPDVEIARLQEVLHCTAEELKPVVMRLCDQGIFIPGKGDWSFATPAARAAAVLIQGDPHLFVRMKD